MKHLAIFSTLLLAACSDSNIEKRSNDTISLMKSCKISITLIYKNDQGTTRIDKDVSSYVDARHFVTMQSPEGLKYLSVAQSSFPNTCGEE